MLSQHDYLTLTHGLTRIYTGRIAPLYFILTWLSIGPWPDSLILLGLCTSRVQSSLSFDLERSLLRSALTHAASSRSLPWWGSSVPSPSRLQFQHRCRGSSPHAVAQAAPTGGPLGHFIRGHNTQWPCRECWHRHKPRARCDGGHEDLWSYFARQEMGAYILGRTALGE